MLHCTLLGVSANLLEHKQLNGTPGVKQDRIVVFLVLAAAAMLLRWLL